jgi:hypothetical protein
MFGTGLTGAAGRSDRSELSYCSCSVCEVACMHSSRGSCIGSGGACMCAGGALCGFRTLVWWVPHFAGV